MPMFCEKTTKMGRGINPSSTKHLMREMVRAQKRKFCKHQNKIPTELSIVQNSFLAEVHCH